MKYMVVLEKGESSYGAFVPDLPGCIAVGENREETLRLIEEAVAFHVEGLRADGLPVPPPQCDVAQVEVDAVWNRSPPAHSAAPAANTRRARVEDHVVTLPPAGFR